MGADAEKLREELRRIGERRRRLGVEVESLASETRKAVKRARGVISMTETAQLLGLDRTSLYQSYGAAADG